MCVPSHHRDNNARGVVAQHPPARPVVMMTSSGAPEAPSFPTSMVHVFRV